MLEFQAFSEKEAMMMNPLRLAHVGDAVHDLLVRTGLALRGGNVHSMHGGAVREVNAQAQAQALARIEPMLSECEADIVRRGRNANAHHGVPKRVRPVDYAMATGLEALLGFLYLTGQTGRLKILYGAMQQETDQ
ncbi:MAG: ribonuclease III [Clostridia bacterium]|nr:ribonuclease III [Clostridia bacterium]